MRKAAKNGAKNAANRTRRLAFLGLMLAAVFVLSALEHMLPPLPFVPPNVKLGLSNIVVMYCVFFVGKSSAVTINALKALFVFLTRGPVAGLLSLCGGMLSIGVIILFVVIFKEKISYTLVSVFGAVAHNVGQAVAVTAVLGSLYALYYLPVLVVSGIIMGAITGVLLRVVLPVFKNTLRF